MTENYTAVCEWDDTGWWVVTIPEVPGAVTQCRRLDQVPADVAEVIKLLTGQSPDEYELHVDARFPGAPGEAAARAAALRAQSKELAAQAHQASATAVRALRQAGLPFRDIGALVGVSYQRAQQIVEETEAKPQTARRRDVSARVVKVPAGRGSRRG